ncbi:uncharacterized protein I303_104801 [Kwoniella dejecticola CBS 10117]|uniref:FAD-binding domain-containing protein n=1 Tax=Kwoniella dejecticola CBS 10117 TaxID=1296121 RepID=A0A1A6A4B2_9TREE|nr:uncharacterized protein I303_04218 [Kwoniella dejecticola CBS 10117]OBR84896.1 hypothetical protein I303_04218 [Kwoniella dejecticola CBS 10117]
MSLSTAAKKTVLISGGSIAGPATAFWLNRYGFKTTIVERWPELRPGGQSVDVQHYGMEAIIKMGLGQALKDRFTGETGTTFTDKNNKVYMNLPVGQGPTNETEILRGDFADMLYQETKNDTEWVFGDYVTSVNEQEAAGKVEVGFNSGKKDTYDYLIIAEGARSWGRKAASLDQGVEYRPIGCYIAYFSIPFEESTPFKDQWHVVALPRKRCIYYRPDFKANTQRAGVMFISNESKGYEKLSQQEQKAKIAELYADGGENADRMIKYLDQSDDLYFEYLGQVHAPKWSSSSGRVHLVGDAAWCGTPMIGMGCSLSVAGAYILSGEMAKHMDDPKAAARGYEENWRPTVTEAQKIAPGIPHIMFQETEWGNKVFLNIMSAVGFVVGSRFVQAIGPIITKIWNRLFPSQEQKTLPDYEQYLVERK